MQLTGVAASPQMGLARATVVTQRLIIPGLEIISPREVDEHLAVYRQAVATLNQKYEKAVRDLEAQQNQVQKDIIVMHQMFLNDEILRDSIEAKIRQCYSATSAIVKAVEEESAPLLQLESAYFRERVQDIKDVTDRLIGILQGAHMPDFTQIDEELILVADEISPYDMATISPQYVRGIVTTKGSTTSHTAILAQSMGVAAVMGCSIDSIVEGELLFVDGVRGVVERAISPERETELRAAIDSFHADTDLLERYKDLPAQTKDGTPIELAANILDTGNLDKVVEYRADGIGLLRTEFLYLTEVMPPSEEEQFGIYETVNRTLDYRPVTIRTIDLGGEKTVPSIGLEPELNPLLGMRGIRLCFEHPEIFLAQLRAILRANHKGNVRMLLPMISGVHELFRVRTFIDRAKAELEDRGMQVPNIQLGVMVEVPSAALVSDILLQHCDFLSIGTNDLTQYTIAADRQNPKIYMINSHFNPGLLKLIEMTVKNCIAAGKPCSVCGEMGADPLAVPLLLGMGVRSFSMNTSSLLQIKQLLSTISVEEAEALVERVRGCVRGGEVVAEIKHSFPQLADRPEAAV